VTYLKLAFTSALGRECIAGISLKDKMGLKHTVGFQSKISSTRTFQITNLTGFLVGYDHTGIQSIACVSSQQIYPSAGSENPEFITNRFVNNLPLRALEYNIDQCLPSIKGIESLFDGFKLLKLNVPVEPATSSQNLESVSEFHLPSLREKAIWHRQLPTLDLKLNKQFFGEYHNCIRGSDEPRIIYSAMFGKHFASVEQVLIYGNLNGVTSVQFVSFNLAILANDLLIGKPQSTENICAFDFSGRKGEKIKSLGVLCWRKNGDVGDIGEEAINIVHLRLHTTFGQCLEYTTDDSEIKQLSGHSEFREIKPKAGTEVVGLYYTGPEYGLHSLGVFSEKTTNADVLKQQNCALRMVLVMKTKLTIGRLPFCILGECVG
jgi:hypothetical protein